MTELGRPLLHGPSPMTPATWWCMSALTTATSHRSSGCSSSELVSPCDTCHNHSDTDAIFSRIQCATTVSYRFFTSELEFFEDLSSPRNKARARTVRGSPQCRHRASCPGWGERSTRWYRPPTRERSRERDLHDCLIALGLRSGIKKRSEAPPPRYR